MLVTAPVRGCRRHGQRIVVSSLFGLRKAQVAQRQSVLSHSSINRQYYSAQAHHKARIEAIRNIGIIAHVDAVRF